MLQGIVLTSEGIKHVLKIKTLSANTFEKNVIVNSPEALIKIAL